MVTIEMTKDHQLIIPQKRCLSCKELIPPARRKQAKYCSERCCNASHNAQRGKPVHPDLPCGTVGALSELLAAAELLSRGYEVFRAVSPASSADLAVIQRDGERSLQLVEVRTGYRHQKKGHLIYSKTTHRPGVVIAVVCYRPDATAAAKVHEVVFLPDLPPLPPPGGKPLS